MTTERAVADSFVRTWVRLYTLGLDESNQSDRRAEIESDLWEHRNYAAAEGRGSTVTSLSILGRWLAGISADLSWRVSHRGRRGQPREGMMKNALGNYWQALAAFAATATGYFGIRQFFTDEVSAGITTGKVLALVLFVGVALLVLAGLGVHRKNPRTGALMVMIGLLPLAAIGGFGIGLVVGSIMALASGQGWWWLPVGIASAIATLAGVGAFGAWWHASPNVASSNPRATMLPLVLVGVGLLTAGSGVALGMFTSPLVVVGAMLAAAGVVIWTRYLKAVR
jgi:hypothetical protein